jgi:hypothetical protein
MPIQFDYQTDTLYLRGFEEGRKEEHKRCVLSIWQNGIEPLVIAKWLNLPIVQIKRIIAEFQSESVEKVAEK